MEAYEQVRVIGKGSFGVVTEIIRKSDGKVLVWKEVNYGAMSEKEKQLIVSEVNILRELRHPHIVRYLDRVIDKQAMKIYIVMEYCEGGDLSQFIKRKKREGSFIEEDFIWHVFTHIYLALRECHRHREGNVVRPILHRDIKPGNIFLDSNGNAKLGDFGLAKELKSESRFAQTNVGTPYYMSPEMVNEMTYDDRSDIWALGCLLYEMATLAPPFDATNQLALAKKINAGRFAPISSRYTEGLFQAIRWQLHRQRSRRPRIEDLERIPELQQRLRAYAAANPAVFQSFSSSSSALPATPSTPAANAPDVKQLQATYNTKMKELLGVEENLRRQEAELNAREKKLKGNGVDRWLCGLYAEDWAFVDLEVEYLRREAVIRKRELSEKGKRSSGGSSDGDTSESHTSHKASIDNGIPSLSSYLQSKQPIVERSNSGAPTPSTDASSGISHHSDAYPTSYESYATSNKPVVEASDTEANSDASLASVKHRLYTNKQCSSTSYNTNQAPNTLRKHASAPREGGKDVTRREYDSNTTARTETSSSSNPLLSSGKVRSGGHMINLVKGFWKKNTR
uniref:non-specific serine/threonine protein kinase n=1 Tax=Albugo laibachii Nc14 TaxID=890382 RepID=F0W9M7_9STRA|nr:protein kinase putative [Albugo laibachii Nc14]|eukprot:CCA17845.1 protein kinase putative [Albugo laibachii Nc14]